MALENFPQSHAFRQVTEEVPRKQVLLQDGDGGTEGNREGYGQGNPEAICPGTSQALPSESVLPPAGPQENS